MTTKLHTYREGPIEQIVMPGENVGIWVNKVYEFYKVDYVEPITYSDPVTINLGALAAGAQSNVTQLTALQMPDSEFAQLRMRVLDDVNLIVYQGRADQRHKLQNVVSTVNRFTHLNDPCGHQTECFEFEDNYIFLQADNQTGYALTQARVVFWGFRYVLEFQPQYNFRGGNLPEIWTRVPATAHL
ncbi:MAG: hypothetical protein WAO71_03600 [Gallionella sp.]